MRFTTLLLLVACASMPDVPDIDLCIMDFPREQVICQGFVDHSRKKDISIEEADRYLMVSPEDWGRLRDYVGDLQDELEQCD